CRGGPGSAEPPIAYRSYFGEFRERGQEDGHLEDLRGRASSALQRKGEIRERLLRLICRGRTSYDPSLPIPCDLSGDEYRVVVRGDLAPANAAAGKSRPLDRSARALRHAAFRRATQRAARPITDRPSRWP